MRTWRRSPSTAPVVTSSGARSRDRDTGAIAASCAPEPSSAATPPARRGCRSPPIRRLRPRIGCDAAPALSTRACGIPAQRTTAHVAALPAPTPHAATLGAEDLRRPRVARLERAHHVRRGVGVVQPRRSTLCGRVHALPALRAGVAGDVDVPGQIRDRCGTGPRRADTGHLRASSWPTTCSTVTHAQAQAPSRRARGRIAGRRLHLRLE